MSGFHAPGMQLALILKKSRMGNRDWDHGGK
jgi:hypothetical protein